MSGRVLRFAGSEHSQALRLLPWYVNGTLEDEERALVARHLVDCRQCRDEVEELRQMQALYAAPQPQMDATPSFARLRSRLQGERPKTWEVLRRKWLQAPFWLRTTLAVQCGVMLVVVGVLLGRDPVDDRTADGAAAEYRTLGDAPSAAASSVVGDDARLVVVFDPKVRHARVQQLLRSSGARIVDGPNDVGAYVLAVPKSRRAAVQDLLRADPDVVSAEPLDRE